MNQDDWKAFFVSEVDTVGIYDIYDGSDTWRAQVRWPRRRSSDVYVLLQRDGTDNAWAADIHGRDAWRKWLQAHQGNL